MIATPPHSPGLPGSPSYLGTLCVPCPAPPPSSPCPPPPFSLGMTLRTPSLSSCPTQSLDLRRHSWQPGHLGSESEYPSEYQQRSVSLGGFDSEEMDNILHGALEGPVRGGRDPRRAPITSYSQEMASLLSLTEEEGGCQTQLVIPLESCQLQGFSSSAPALCASPSEHQLPSLHPHPQAHTHTHTEKPQHQHQQPHHRSHSSNSQRQHQDSSPGSVFWGSTQCVDAELGELWEEKRKEGKRGVPLGEERRTEGQRRLDPGEERGAKAESHLGRTFSFLRKMAGQRKNKEKERMKEREKEAREREARYSNGHLFTSLTVSATTLCSACNKSITAKEALSCPTCNVTIHNRCRDTLANCAKMKQRQQKLALVRNSSALQNVALRTKTPMMKERPSSAIYPSESIRQSLLGGRRVRSGLSLSKSVSTQNIAGNLNDDSPLGLRRILSQSTDSLNFRNRAMSMESLNDEGEVYYAAMLEELEREGKDFEADSWSRAVDPSYLQMHRKDVIKRQDVIYELIQTEFHHVRTLRIMDGVFRQGMLDEVLLEPGVVHAVFPYLDQLMALHTRFLSQLMTQRTHSLAPGSSTNFTINQLGDILTEQFSGQCADEMRKAYAEFCSRHPKAVKLYKELLARDKRFQHFIRRVSRGPLLRRHGVQECILLVTQRITKYPVLIQRILDNTKGSEEEAQSLAQALSLIRGLLSSVDQQVADLERTQRLQEIQARLDPRAQAAVRGGGVFRGGELLRRTLLHEGTLLWKTQGSRLKDVQVLLMTDILVFLQEKDQKYVFPCLDKPAVLSLKNLIVRDIANQERGMFLISDSTPADMYELHGASRDDRNNWMRLIQQTVSSCPSREDFPLIETEDKALLRRLRADIQQKDREVLELLQERVTLFSDLAEITGGGQDVTPPTNSRNIFRADTPYSAQAEQLLTEAVSEVDRLSELLLGSNIELPKSNGTNVDQNHKGEPVSNGDSMSINGTDEINGSPASKDRNGNQLQDRPLNEEVCQRLVNISAQLHALQAAVILQDSVLELRLCEGAGPASSGSSTPTPPHSVPRLSRSMSRDTGLDAGTVGAAGDMNMLQRQFGLLQEEVVRLRPFEARLRESERARAQMEQQLRELQGRRGSRGSRGSSGDIVVDVIAIEKVPAKIRGSCDGEPGPVAPLACQEPVDQLDGVQEGSEEEESEEEADVVRISPRSDSPRDLQDIPEESECGPEAQESKADSMIVPS
ncbi:rho guanine nucleotide exchange factor 2 isoform X1 [Esox lucius]|nr:rho guanine nucleotide exchange factor 2 isoform X1 [Esox lucius]